MEYPDDANIGPDGVIWRRIPPDKIQRDPVLGRYRPQSGMFSDSRDGTPMSASRADLHSSPNEFLQNSDYPDYLLVSLRVEDIRNLGLAIASQPPTDDPGHVWIVGKKTPGRQKKLARLAKWVIGPKPEYPAAR